MVHNRVRKKGVEGLMVEPARNAGGVESHVIVSCQLAAALQHILIQASGSQLEIT